MKACLKCETSNSLNDAFCINCGVPLEITPAEQPVESDATTPKVSRGKQNGALFAVAVVGIIVGVLITANGLAKPVIGARYTQAELTKFVDFSFSKGYEDGQTKGYNSGKDDGNTVGYSSGNDDGYRTGYSDGCNNVFDEVGYTEIIGIFYPYYTSNTGRNYFSQSDLCD